MDAYLLTWKPDEWSHEELDLYIDDFQRGNTVQRWSCGGRKNLPIGSRVFLTKQGTGQRGIFGSGHTVTEPFEAPHYNSDKAAAGKSTTFVNVRFDHLFDPRTGIKIGIEELQEIHPTIWNAQGSGKQIPLDAAATVSSIWLDRVGALPDYYPDEISQDHYEGAKKSVLVNSYERDPVARQKCLDKWHHSCAVCGFHFEYFYGPLGKDYIHVHHLKPLSEIGKEYKVDPVIDLRPVCPNCHAMLHRRKPALSIQELAELIAKYGKRVGS